MTVSDVAKLLNLRIVNGHKGLDREVKGAYISDLLSDVMGYAKEGQIWITLQSHKNVMAIASLKDIAAVILVKEIMPDAECARYSDEENIPVLTTGLETFEIAGKLYNLIVENE